MEINQKPTQNSSETSIYPQEEQITTKDPDQWPSISSTHFAPLWLPVLALIGVSALNFFLPEHLTLGPTWFLSTLEGIFILPLTVSLIIRRKPLHGTMRFLVFVPLFVATAGLIANVVLLVNTLPKLEQSRANTLLHSAIIIWLINILVFSLWYWEIDGGGPIERHKNNHEAADFLFPQQANGNTEGWIPLFIDYLFVAFTGATAFSPTDTLPLTRRVKTLMMVEAAISMLIVLFLAARAVNIL